MQVIYKSSYEYDVESGTYKRVDKEVEQSSFDNDFTNALDAIEESGILQSEELQNRNFKTKPRKIMLGVKKISKVSMQICQTFMLTALSKRSFLQICNKIKMKAF